MKQVSLSAFTNRGERVEADCHRVDRGSRTPAVWPRQTAANVNSAPLDRVRIGAAIDRLRAMPHFSAVLPDALDHILNLRAERLTLRLFGNDRVRAAAGMFAVWLHHGSEEAGASGGLTLSSMCMMAERHALCGRGRMLAIVAAMRLGGFIERVPPSGDRRVASLRPTDRLIALLRERILGHVRCLRRILRAPSWPAAEIDDEFTIHVIRRLMQHYEAGVRLFDFAPELAGVSERDMGMMALCDLVLLAGDTARGRQADLSLSMLAKRHGVSRAHIRTMLTDLAAHGLLARTEAGRTTVIVLPPLETAVERVIATVWLAILDGVQHAARREGSSMQGAPIFPNPSARSQRPALPPA